ncbi:MAG: adenylate/guanylate cyclase domain-containing protein, partial [Stellaceae bacterium]
TYLAYDHIQPAAGPNDDLKLGPTVIPPLDDKSGPYIKLDNRGYQVLLDYHHGAKPFPRVSVGEVMDRDLSAMVRGRAVIIGGTEVTVKDSFPTPFSTGFGGTGPDYGIEIHAHLANQLIDEAHGRVTLRTGLPRLGEDAWIVAWALAGAALGLLARATLAAVAGGAAGLALIGAIVYAAFTYQLLLPAVPAALSWTAAAALTNQVLYAATNRARARLRKSFEHYLPPVVIERMVAADALPRLGGERREISVLFTDVAGFTTFSERLDPEDLAALANEYFDGVCHAIFAHGGLVNAFIGDSVLAFFGAPVDQPDHADRTIAAALDVDKFACGFMADLAARGIEFGHTRIGLHTGVAFVGNIGTQERLQYTALGDMLNTGSRLEGLNKAIGTRIAASGDIAAKATGHRFRPVGSFVVKGRTGATEVLTPINPTNSHPERETRYEAAFRAASTGCAEAAVLFAALYRENPDDPCIAFHHRRLAAGETGTAIHMDEK